MTDPQAVWGEGRAALANAFASGDGPLQAAAAAFTDAFENSLLISPPVATFLLQLVDSVNYTVTAATIDQQAALIAQAKRELGAQ